MNEETKTTLENLKSSLILIGLPGVVEFNPYHAGIQRALKEIDRLMPARSGG